MIIRPEKTSDAEKVRYVNLQAFETAAEANLVDALRNTSTELISLVAEENGEIIGHILFSPVSIDSKVKIMGLAPMAVLPAWQGKGVGSRLVNAGLKVCSTAGYVAVVVLGHPAYYPRFGFEPSVNFGIDTEYEVPAEVFMVRELHKDALKNIKGTIKYNRVFKDLES